MKVREFAENNKELPDKLSQLIMDEASIWTNEACYGYVIAAMTNAGYDRDTIADLLPYLHSAFGERTVEEAEQHYKDWAF